MVLYSLVYHGLAALSTTNGGAEWQLFTMKYLYKNPPSRQHF